MKISVTKAFESIVKVLNLRYGEYAQITSGQFAGYTVMRMADRAALLATGGYIEASDLGGTTCRRLEPGDVLTITF